MRGIGSVRSGDADFAATGSTLPAGATGPARDRLGGTGRGYDRRLRLILRQIPYNDEAFFASTESTAKDSAMAKKKGAIQKVTDAVKDAVGTVVDATKTGLENMGLKNAAPAPKPAKKAAKKKVAAKPAAKPAATPAKKAAKKAPAKPAKKKAAKKK
jgi:hypothetical protein